MAAPLSADRMAYVNFAASPFPYRGIIPDKNVPFLDVQSFFFRGHTSPRGGVIYPEYPTYSDKRSLIYFPRGFDIKKPAVIVMFLHGNNVILSRDVVERQQVPRQVLDSGINAVLIAPQFAVDALDSSAGSFWTAGTFARYLDEAAGNMANVLGDATQRATFARLPVVLVAFSGGYDAAAFAVKVGGANRRITGLVFLDAPYDYEAEFADFLARNRSVFMFSSYAKSSASNNALMMKYLTAKKVPYATTAPARLSPGTIAFVAAKPDLKHDDFVTQAWVADPVAWVLRRIPGYAK